MLETITHLITNFGYIIVAVFILLECAGLPLPGETALLVAAGFAGTGKLSIGAVIIVAAAAAVLGDAGGYWIGRLLGRGFVTKWGRYLGLNEKKMDFLQNFFVRHGPPTVFFGRFVTILRTWAALFAGISKMPYLSFTIFNALGGILWATTFGLLGYLFGSNLDDIEHLIRIFGWGALFGVTLLATGWYVRRWTSAAPSAAYDGKPVNFIVRIRNRLAGSALVATSDGRTRFSRISISVLYVAGLGICALLLVFVSGTTHTLLQYDPVLRFEEMITTAIDTWLTERQSLILLYIAKLGSAVTLGIGLVTSLISLALGRRMYMFTMLFGILGGETLNGLLVYLNRGYGAFVSSHLSTKLWYLLALDNIMVPVIVIGMLTYFAILPTRQLLSAVSIIAGMGGLALVIVAGSFLSGLHGSIEFLEELICAIVWLWVCIGLMGFIRSKREQADALRRIAEGT